MKLGIAKAAIIKRIATTIKSSISEKPFCLLPIFPPLPPEPFPWSYEAPRRSRPRKLNLRLFPGKSTDQGDSSETGQLGRRDLIQRRISLAPWDFRRIPAAFNFSFRRRPFRRLAELRSIRL